MKRGKRYLQATQTLDKSKTHSIEEAIEILKKMPPVKFDQTVEVTCRLNVDPKKSDQMVRGSVVLPHGTGKKKKVLVFCEPEKEKEAQEAGADYVGGQELADKILKENWLDFDYCISTPQMMRIVSKLGRILGPRGLMPSPKVGTVTENIAFSVKEAKKGKVDFRVDKTGCVHAGVGKISFSTEKLKENIEAFLNALKNAKPQNIKGEFIKSAHLSLSMSPSIKIDAK
ncbi:MAG: 50S ribosomal protein L1 [Candidatus Omnitrophota bacterium]|nr:MAG: 50S ribosomal protein L1 [Candidatus Omnitrophota bacterium]RKY45694.1 MAG: 50S ribosomal protein L1 [Candidatus Omnitrophota bacterium]